MRLAAALLALVLVPSAVALAPDADVCGASLSAPPAGSVVCVRITLITPAGTSYANATATAECDGTGPTSAYHVNASEAAYAPTGNPGLTHSDQGNYAKLPYLCEL